MNTVRFRDVLHAVVHLMGRNPLSGDFSPEEAAMITSFINLRVAKAWTWAWWPDLVRNELMPYRPVWREVKSWAKGDEVYEMGQGGYWRSKIDDNANQLPSASPEAWEEVEYFAKYIPYNHPDFEPIGHVHGVTERYPFGESRSGRRFEFTLDRNGVVLGKEAPALVWVRYRVPVPMYSAEEVDPLKGYPAGYVVYGPDGHCYISTAAISPDEELWVLDAFGNIQDGSGAPVQLWELDESGDVTPTVIYQQFTDKWKRVHFPQFLMSTIVRAAYSDYLRAQGQHDKAIVDEAMFMEELLVQADLLVQQGQIEFVQIS